MPSTTTDFQIIRGDALADKADALAAQWQRADPFPLMVIDDFCDPEVLGRICDAFPSPESLSKSRDYIFAKDKFEKNAFRDLHPDMARLHDDLLSEAFGAFIRKATGLDVFVDPSFHGGGLHMGGAGSFLDMHADFNIHPEHPNWQRELNILLYLNRDWKPAYGGQLKLRNAHTGASTQVEPIFNRAAIMLTKDFTLHGYDKTSFPEGTYRQSIASYAYQELEAGAAVKPYTTLWHSDSSFIRSMIGPQVFRLVRLKNRLFGSGSSKNK